MKKEEQHLSIYLIVVDTTIGNFMCFWTVASIAKRKSESLKRLHRICKIKCRLRVEMNDLYWLTLVLPYHSRLSLVSMMRIPKSTTSCPSIMKNSAFAPSVDKSNTLTADENNHKCIKTSRGTNLLVAPRHSIQTLTMLTCNDVDCGLPGRPASPDGSFALELSAQILGS